MNVDLLHVDWSVAKTEYFYIDRVKFDKATILELDSPDLDNSNMVRDRERALVDIWVIELWPVLSRGLRAMQVFQLRVQERITVEVQLFVRGIERNWNTIVGVTAQEGVALAVAAVDSKRALTAKKAYPGTAGSVREGSLVIQFVDYLIVRTNGS